MLSSDIFEFEDSDVPDLQNGEVLLKGIYYSVDPYMRGRMNDVKSYSPPFQIGQPIEGGVVAKVTVSKADGFKAGDVVLGRLPWKIDIVENGNALQKIDTNFAPPSYYLGILGMPGLTAYFGMMDICVPKAGETVVVSGAAGAVGLIAGQLAKIQGCRVIGIAGSDEKVKLLKEDFGFDEGVNYKTTRNLKKDVAKLCPNQIDAYFDNVGGEISDAVIANLNFHSKNSFMWSDLLV